MKKRLLLVGHTYMVAVNRMKALHLASHFEVRVCTNSIENLIVLGRQVVDHEPESHRAAFETRRLKPFPSLRKHTKFILPGLYREIREFRPDILLLENEPWSWLRWQARFAAWLADRSILFAEFTWENIRRDGFKGRMVSLIYRLMAMTGDKVICGSTKAAELCIEGGFPKNSVLVAPQLGIEPGDHPAAGADLRDLWRASLGWPPGCLVVGFCGRLVEEKGLLDLVAAIQTLRSQGINVRLALLGEGVLRGELETIDPEREWLTILFSVPHDEIPAFLNKLDIFILPSKPRSDPDGGVWEEQFGHVLIESMACGILTLGSDSGAIPEVLCDPEVIFENGNIAAIRDILANWLADNSERSTKAASQAVFCASKYSHSHIAEIYAAFLTPHE
jgi:L-malate glycosyltransferase